MTITVKFFASLRENLGVSEVQLSHADVSTVADAWSLATESQTMPPNTLAAVNMDYVEIGHSLQDGDEVAFFPPVSGG